MSDSDSDNWFDKDEDEIVEEFKKSLKIKEKQKEAEVEIIKASTDEFLREQQTRVLKTSTTQSSNQMSTVDLRHISQLEPLDAFLFVYTRDCLDFFKNQISMNDGLERVLLYVEIMAKISELELPGFHHEIIKYFVEDEILLEHFRLIANKMFIHKYSEIWNAKRRIEDVVRNVQTLLLNVYQHGMMTNKIKEIIQHILKIMEKTDSPNSKLDLCCEFYQNLKRIMQNFDTEEQKLHGEVEKAVVFDEIYPSFEEVQTFLNENDDEENSSSLEDLLQHYEENNVDQKDNENEVDTKNLISNQLHCIQVAEYIDKQKRVMREDFLLPFRTAVRTIKKTKSLKTYTEQVLFIENVSFIVNEKFETAMRHEHLFVDAVGNRDINGDNPPKNIRQALYGLKTGALLCFSSNENFEDLIFAVVIFTSQICLKAGYIGIEILQQYNIGNIYGRKFIMFESPAFFAPYQHVYNYLKTCKATSFPLRQYIIFGETDMDKPAYVTPKTIYKFQSEEFQLEDDGKRPPKTLALNPSQLNAYCNALKQELCLIQGPPGTGKTHLSVRLVKTLMESVATPIVLVTYTNDSLDKFLLKLAEYTSDFARFGNRTKIPEIEKYSIGYNKDKFLVNPQLKRLYYVVDIEFKNKFKRLHELHQDFTGTEENYVEIVAAQKEVRKLALKLDTIRVLFLYYEAKQTGLIALTTTCAARTNYLFRLLKSSVVIFEEAAEIHESHVIACLTPFTQHLILIGDHQQLKPFTNKFMHKRTAELNISLFERLITSNIRPSVLTVQYRMRPKIAALLCPTIYKELQNDGSVETFPPVRKMEKNVYFFTHSEQEDIEMNEVSFYNKFEATQIFALAEHLIGDAEYNCKNVVILSPYIKQVQYIKNLLHPDNQDKKQKRRTKKKKIDLSGIKVHTIDSFQGLEADIILLSLVRCNQTGQIGFLRQSNRICVALSRARLGLYMIGNLEVLSKCKVWKAIKHRLEEQDAIGNKFPYSGKNPNNN